jgi:hypothetical protein
MKVANNPVLSNGKYISLFVGLEKRVCLFASSLLAVSPGLDAQTALKAALQVVRIMIEIEAFEAEEGRE